MNEHIDYTIVVEWANPSAYRLRNRQRELLASVARQMLENDATGEIIIVYNVESGEGSVVEHFVAELFTTIPAVLVPSRELTYYQMKNAGIDRARGRLVLLVDSDIVLPPRYLESVLRAFDDPAVNVLATAVTTQSKTIREKIWSFVSPFPAPSAETGRVAATGFFANSVSFRSGSVSFRFDETDTRARMQCVALGRQLTENGITIWRDHSLRVLHPAPDSIRGMLRHARRTGDDVYKTHQLHSGKRAAFLRSLWYLIYRAGHCQWRVLREWRVIGLAPPLVPVAAVAVAFYSMAEIGALMIAAF